MPLVDIGDTQVVTVTSTTTSQASLRPTLFANAPSFTPVAMNSVRKTGKTAPVVDQGSFRAVKTAVPRVAPLLPGLFSPGTKAAQYVTHTWERVNANAAKSVIHKAMPKKEAACAPTWPFSVFPGKLGHMEGKALPDPSYDKMMRLVRNAWGEKRTATLVGACA